MNTLQISASLQIYTRLKFIYILNVTIISN